MREVETNRWYQEAEETWITRLDVVTRHMISSEGVGGILRGYEAYKSNETVMGNAVGGNSWVLGALDDTVILNLCMYIYIY